MRKLNEPTGKVKPLDYIPEPGAAQKEPDELAIAELERQWWEEHQAQQAEHGPVDEIAGYPFK